MTKQEIKELIMDRHIIELTDTVHIVYDYDTDKLLLKDDNFGTKVIDDSLLQIMNDLDVLNNI